MAKVNFYLKEASSKKETLIYLQFYFNSQKWKFYTGEKIAPSKWNPENQRVKKSYSGASEINNLLDKLEADIKKIYRDALASELVVTQDFLKEELSKSLQKDIEPPKNFFEQMEYYKEIKTGKLSYNYLKKVTTLKNHIKEFEKKKKYKVSFDTIDLHFYELFTSFLLNDQMHMNSTIDSNISILKTFLEWATTHNLNQNLKFKDKNFRTLPQNFKMDTDIIYLTEPELMRLFYLDLSKNKRLSNIRESFCFGCFTGLRFSDIARIGKENITDEELHFITQKTKDKLIIPLSDYAMEILIRNDFQLPVISIQKTNSYLKELGELAEIKESIIITKFKGVEAIEKKEAKYNFITSHTARRTFVTLSLEKGMRVETVMAITGHKNYKTFKKYIKITDKVKAIEMKEIWKRKPELKVVKTIPENS